METSKGIDPWTGGKAGEEEAKEIGLGKYSCGPVSYTHLDVYKRQKLG